MNKKFLKKCEACNGRGYNPMPKEYIDTYIAILSMPNKKANVYDLCKKFPDVKSTAMNNRLYKLYKSNLLKRKKIKKAFIYTIA